MFITSVSETAPIPIEQQFSFCFWSAGECIPAELKCDGKADCVSKSDESLCISNMRQVCHDEGKFASVSCNVNCFELSLWWKRSGRHMEESFRASFYLLPAHRGVTRVERGAQFPGRRITRGKGGHNSRGRWKAPTMLQVLSSVQYICFRKTSGSNMGAPNLLLAPGTIWPRYAPASRSCSFLI